ncbi:hypothetical protein EZS27_024060 [termite gut metagenome]|uniref:Protein BatD n=1 Tax=termite gut metagenome TaxID=433724 RepID=A0A5J4QY76_9ZZZZ
MRKLILLFTAFLFPVGNLFADDNVTFTASAPDAVVVGQQFRLEYTITAQKVRDFRAPNIKGFDMLMGPNSRIFDEQQWHNGKVTRNSGITYTYILLATNEGEFSIPGATITVDGKQLLSNSVKVKVLPTDKTDNENGDQASSSSSSSVSNQDLFVTATVNKSGVYEQEAFLLTFKLYTSVDARFDNVKLPDFNGFHSQEVELPQNHKWELENYKGRNYRSVVYRQFVLFSQHTGLLTIDPVRFDAVVNKPVQSADPFDAFFNGGSSHIEVKKTISSPKLTIDVKALPAKPADFYGGVGDFTISSSINNTNIKTNDAVTLKVVISGIGNLRLISIPKVEFPSDFETYEPKVDNKVRLTTDGHTGSKVIEYLTIPRHAGTFKIPALTFSYFDVKSKSYKTLTTEEYTLTVEKGEGNSEQVTGNFTNKEDLRVLGEDIRFIKLNEVRLHPKGNFFFGSTTYWLFYIIPVLAFIVFIFISRKLSIENANVTKMRMKQANKVAIKRLKLAGTYLAEQKKDLFYDEVLKALWGYIGDRLNIPVSQLSKDFLREKVLVEANDELKEATNTFLNVLHQCEFARFAPSTDDKQAMDNVYSSAISAISKMENVISEIF